MSDKIKVLIVCSVNSGNVIPFITDQMKALKALDIDIEIYPVQGKGIRGYLRNLKPLKQKIRSFQPDILHAHFGLSALLANLQRKVPVVSTYHGSDINEKKVFPFSRIAMVLSAYNIFVSDKNVKKAKPFLHYSLIPCGVDIQLFKPDEKIIKVDGFSLNSGKKNILFAGAFDIKVKNAPLAQAGVALLKDVDLIELKNFTRLQVAQLMNSVDAVLLTSHTEGSPQFIKEAMACNCPVVSVDAGDVAALIAGVENCFLVDRKPEAIADALTSIFNSCKKSNSRAKIIEMKLDAVSIAESIKKIYQFVIQK